MSKYVSSSSSSSSGIGCCSALCIALIVLKLCHVIDWSWWWVLAPVWIPCIIILLLLGLVGWIVAKS